MTTYGLDQKAGVQLYYPNIYAIPWLPTFTGFGTVTNSFLKARRVGSNLHLSGVFQAGTVSGVTASLTLPLNLTFGGNPTLNQCLIGYWDRGNAAANVAKGGSMIATNGSNLINFAFDDYSIAGSPFAATTGANVCLTGEVVSLTGELIIPIAEWADQNSVIIGPTAFPQYATNTSTSTTNDTTSFGNSPAGVAFTAMAPGGVFGITKRVRFLQPVVTASAPKLKIYEPTNPNVLVDFDSRVGTFGINSAGTLAWGYRIIAVPGSFTDFDVIFYSTATQQTADAWSGLASAGWKWVLQSVNPQAPVGIKVGDNITPGVVKDRKEYVAGTVYTNGTPTLTSGQAGFSNARTTLVPYQTVDGAWRLTFNIAATFTVVALLGVDVAISGLTFPTVQGAGGLFGGSSTLPGSRHFTNLGTNVITSQMPTSSSTGGIYISGDVELTSKPTWAD